MVIAAAGEIIHERLIDRRAFELEVIEVFGERQFGDGEPVIERACFSLISALSRLPKPRGGRNRLGDHILQLSTTLSLKNLRL